MLRSLLLACLLVPSPVLAEPSPLARLADRYWDERAAGAPEEASYYGDQRFADQLADLSPAAEEKRLAAARVLLRDARALDEKSLGADERATRDLLLELLGQQLDGARFHPLWWWVSQNDGPQVTLAQLAATVHPRATARDAETMAARWRKVPTQLAQYEAQLRDGLAHGYAAPRVIVERVMRQIDDLTAGDPARSLFATPFDGVKLPEPEGAKRRAELAAAARDQVIPALRRLREFFQRDYLPHARATVGVSELPDGAALYRHAIRVHTTTARTPAELNRLGLDELARIEAELSRTARAAGLSGDLPSQIEALRRSEAGHPFRSREEVVAAYRTALDRFQAALPRAFGTLPTGKMVVRPMPAYMEQDGGRAYYDPPPEDNSRPGTFWVNTRDPERHVQHAVEAVAAHEGVPGHHLQSAIDAERRDRPRLRRYLGINAFIEGWALYAERLVDELGLYADPKQRMGMLLAQSFRAVRLVVDTGMHSLGWTRARAIEFFVAHSSEPREHIEQEIDRYIAWPGQALAYLVGRMEIDAARAEASARLGARFSLRDFHDRLLSVGAVPLPTLRRALSDQR